MKVKNVSGRPREIASTGQVVKADATVDVSDDLGRSLIRQTRRWSEVKPPPPPPKPAPEPAKTQEKE